MNISNVNQIDVISSLLILDAVSGAVFYGLVFTGLCLVNTRPCMFFIASPF